MHYIESFNKKPEVLLQKEPTISNTAVIKNCYFGEYTEISEYTMLEDTTLDNYSYICEYCNIIYTDIGKFANIASSCRINPGFHPMERPTLHHFTYRSRRYGFSDQDDTDYFYWRKLQKVIIGHDVWIGHGVVIMPGVRIGNGAVIGSNSVVTKDVPSYTVVGGTPVKILRRRFPESISNVVEKTMWWDWDHKTLKERLEDFKDLRKFIKKYGKQE